VPGFSSQSAEDTLRLLSEERFHRQLLTLGRHADIVVLDVGSAENELTGRFCQSAGDVLLLTTPDDATVMDTYARVKTTLVHASHPDLHVLVNHCNSLAQAKDVHLRLDDSCLKFLDRRIGFAGHVPFDERVSEAAINAKPFLLRSPQADCSQAIHQLATCITMCHAAPHTTSRAA
jgi:flagellar biosynthesis protein FlhG